MNAAAPSFSVREDLKLAGVFGLAAAIATALLFPYLLQLMPQAFEKVPLPLAVLIPLQSFQAGLLFSLLAFVGLRLAPRARLGAPWLRAWMQGQPRPPLAWKTAIASGLLAGLAIVAFAALLDPHLPARLPTGSSPPAATADAFNGFLASFYGGIGEEIQLRLFLMTLIVWLIARFGARSLTPPAFWFAIVATALLFGAGHLPAAAQVWPMDAFVVFRTIALNTVAGLVFGWLYWRHGIETAMLAHFSADIVLHVLAPLAGAALA